MEHALDILARAQSVGAVVVALTRVDELAERTDLDDVAAAARRGDAVVAERTACIEGMHVVDLGATPPLPALDLVLVRRNPPLQRRRPVTRTALASLSRFSFVVRIEGSRAAGLRQAPLQSVRRRDARSGTCTTQQSWLSASRLTISSPSTAPTSRRAAAWSSTRYLNAASYIGLAILIASPTSPRRGPTTSNGRTYHHRKTTKATTTARCPAGGWWCAACGTSSAGRPGSCRSASPAAGCPP